MQRVGIIAGELSGDLLGAGLIKAILSRYPDVKFEGIAGPHMQQANCEAWYAADDLAVMGLSEVVSHLPRLLSIKKNVIKRWQSNPPDLFIGIDAPDFTLRVAKVLKQSGVHTMHYVSPSVWAWREGRVKGIAKAVDDLFCLLPFEPEYYSETNVTAHFVGHPMADKIQNKEINPNKDTSGAFQIAVLPGSRQGELNKLAIPFLQTVAILAKRYPQASFHIPAAKETFIPFLEKLILRHAPQAAIVIEKANAGQILAQSDCALIASGTATLEAMLHHCPMVVGYQLARSTAFLLRMTNALKTRYFALPNILANQSLVAEIIQNELTPQRLSAEIIQLLENSDKRLAMQQEFKQLHAVLQQNTDNKVASIVIKQLQHMKHANI
ncbi:MAG: lipid-A-disaccharide synthase [Gammaproteobacteria bacterium]|nr:lipid-A-disaccharide synthase [Gammaproteobacteria bacterium]